MFHRVAENTKDSGQWCEGRKGGGSGRLAHSHTPSNSKQPTDLCHDTPESGLDIEFLWDLQKRGRSFFRIYIKLCHVRKKNKILIWQRWKTDKTNRYYPPHIISWAHSGGLLTRLLARSVAERVIRKYLGARRLEHKRPHLVSYFKRRDNTSYQIASKPSRSMLPNFCSLVFLNTDHQLFLDSKNSF